MYCDIGRVIIMVLCLAVLLTSNIGCINSNVLNAPSTGGQADVLNAPSTGGKVQAGHTSAPKTVETEQVTNPKQLNLKPDLLVTTINPVPGKYAAPFGGVFDAFKIHYIVSNKGKASSTECRMALRKDGQVLYMVSIPALPPEGEIQGDFPIILGPLRADHQWSHPTYEVIVDYEKVVDESDESNNLFVAQWDWDPVPSAVFVP